MPDNTVTPATVDTTLGKVRGQRRTTVYGNQYFCFDGIPYGQAPIGELRFKSPLPAKPWKGVRDGTVIAPKCMQYNRSTAAFEGSEDCLYLNVYAKQLKSDKPLPVIVFVHGGGFTTGTASRLAWGPDYFMMQDVVFISVGYRLGALGFLSLPEPELQVPGNAGVKDVLLALQWIQKNCHNFNGDACNITLMGHSSGSGVVQMLMLAPQCEGLFHRVILMSGLWLHLHSIPQLEYRFATRLGYTGEQGNATILQYLREVSAEQLCDFERIWTKEERERGYAFAFKPTTEHAQSSDAILKQDVLDAFADKEAWSTHIPVMLGGTSQEALMYYKHFTGETRLYDAYKVHPELVLTQEATHKCNDLATKQQLARQLLQQHFGTKPLGVENASCAIEITSYGFLYHPIQRYLRTRLPNACAPTYLYRFDYDSPTFNLYRIKHCGAGVRGVSHVDELSYIFYMPDSFELARDSSEYRTIERLIALITGFATTSDPNTSAAALIKPAVWSPLTNERRMCLNIGDEVSYIEWPEAATCDVWDRLYEQAGIRLF